MRNKFIVIAVGILVVMTGLVSHSAIVAAAAQSTAGATISITSPTEGESVIESNIQVSGTAPPGVLVEINISDTDSSKRFIEHQQYGKVNGNITSDDEGHWVFTPQQTLVPGQFSVQAFYTTPDDQKVTSKTVSFVVTTAGGSSETLSRMTIRGLVIAGITLAVLLVSLMIFFARRRHRSRSSPDSDNEKTKQSEDDDDDKSKDRSAADSPLFLNTPQGRQYQRKQDAKIEAFEEEALKIEDELAKTAEELERANAEVISLRHRFSGEHSDNSVKSRDQIDEQQQDEDQDNKGEPVPSAPEVKKKR